MQRNLNAVTGLDAPSADVYEVWETAAVVHKIGSGPWVSETDALALALHLGATPLNSR